MGSVFEVVHVELERRAALKLMLPQHAQNPQLRARFVREAKATNRVQHPGVVQIYEISEQSDGTPYFIMEYLDGETLAKRLDDASESPAGRLGMAGLHALRQVASIIARVHEKGLIHRDLKPNNMMLVADPEVPGGERAKLLDFGIAKQTETTPARAADPADRLATTEPKTQAGSLLGTPQYMAPEQWGNGKPVTDKVDVYALGVMTYRVLAGRLPFLAEAPLELATQHVFHAPTPLREVSPGLPGDLSEFVDSMLAKTAEARPSMAEVVAKLERILGLPPDAAAGQIVIPDSFSSAQQLPVSGKPTTPVENAGNSAAFIPSARPARADATTSDEVGKRQAVGKTIALEEGDLIAGTEPDRAEPPFSALAPAPPVVGSVSPAGRRVNWLLAVGILLLGAAIVSAWRAQGPSRVPTAADAAASLVAELADAAVVVPDGGEVVTIADSGAIADLTDIEERKDASADVAPPPPPPVTPPPPTKPKPPRPPVALSPACILTPGLHGTEQEKLLIDGFRNSVAGLPPGESVTLVLQNGKPTLLAGPASLRAKKVTLEYTLRGLFAKTPFPAKVDIQCPLR